MNLSLVCQSFHSKIPLSLLAPNPKTGKKHGFFVKAQGTSVKTSWRRCISDAPKNKICQVLASKLWNKKNLWKGGWFQGFHHTKPLTFSAAVQSLHDIFREFHWMTRPFASNTIRRRNMNGDMSLHMNHHINKSCTFTQPIWLGVKMLTKRKRRRNCGTWMVFFRKSLQLQRSFFRQLHAFWFHYMSANKHHIKGSLRTVKQLELFNYLRFRTLKQNNTNDNNNDSLGQT